MGMHGIEQLSRLIDEVATPDDLDQAMREICALLGFQFFALSHHIDLRSAPAKAIRLHNYPDRWADYYEGNALGVSDPVHRASHVTARGFSWGDMPRMIPLTRADRDVLARGRAEGIGDGFTVPAHVPGEARGSCSFANEVGRPLPRSMLDMAQLAGVFAFECARRLWQVRPMSDGPAPAILTDRQRDCAIWVGRGKTDWEIGQILGVKEETATRHVKDALERYGIAKRACLPIETLLDGTLTFDDFKVR